MAIENFLFYIEVDANGKLTVTAPKAESADADADEDVYLYSDKGAGYFDALKDIFFEMYQASTSLAFAQCGMAITNTIGSLIDYVDTDVSVFIWRAFAGIEGRVGLYRGIVATDLYSGSVDTLYYFTLSRLAGNDSVTCKVYDDAARTNLKATLVLAGFGAITWRYLYGFSNYNSGDAGRDHDGYVQNLDLKEGIGAISQQHNPFGINTISAGGGLNG